ncbi:hypothetical protein [Paraburkholderia terrae]|uniref:hypothetical protein n=1 Tax=Paraburkholderia terrae TaxID=311230 RepID=UPI001EE1D684|nr:hypothetical protein [Paraburkholderia terrae]GJH04361.1 hypothetical protein CBA19C8_27410 [Paraburkholderia terrae]
MGQTTREQPNTMDEPGGPEAPLPADNQGDGSKRKDKAAHGAPTDADFEPPIVPGESKDAPRK